MAASDRAPLDVGKSGADQESVAGRQHSGAGERQRQRFELDAPLHLVEAAEAQRRAHDHLGGDQPLHDRERDAHRGAARVGLHDQRHPDHHGGADHGEQQEAHAVAGGDRLVHSLRPPEISSARRRAM
jgi:hypothetical protein